MIYKNGETLTFSATHAFTDVGTSLGHV